MLEAATLALAAAALIAGVIAAVYSYRANKVPIDPGWSVEPGIQDLAQMGWLAGMMKAIDESDKLNRKATLWAVASVVLGSLGGILGTISN